MDSERKLVLILASEWERLKRKYEFDDDAVAQAEPLAIPLDIKREGEDEGKEAEELYDQACDKYQKATEIKPDDHQAYDNWGVTLIELAKIKEGKESESLHNQAFEKYQKATEIKPDDHHAFYNWGTALGI